MTMLRDLERLALRQIYPKAQSYAERVDMQGGIWIVPYDAPHSGKSLGAIRLDALRDHAQELAS